jgi:transposase
LVAKPAFLLRGNRDALHIPKHGNFIRFDADRLGERYTEMDPVTPDEIPVCGNFKALTKSLQYILCERRVLVATMGDLNIIINEPADAFQ